MIRIVELTDIELGTNTGIACRLVLARTEQSRVLRLPNAMSYCLFLYPHSVATLLRNSDDYDVIS